MKYFKIVNERTTEECDILIDKVINILNPIVLEEIRKNGSIREIAHILNLAVHKLELKMVENIDNNNSSQTTEVYKKVDGALEPCCICYNPTSNWLITKDVAICPTCYNNSDINNIPSKEEWFKEFESRSKRKML